MKRILPMIAALAAALLSCALPAAASQNTAGFSALPLLPENQQDGVTGYFDLLVEPGAVQSLEVVVHNPGEQAISLTLEAFTATTGRGGSVNYASAGESDETLAHAFADMAQVPRGPVLLPPGASETVSIPVRMPDEAFEGIILGSIQVTKELSEEEIAQGGAILNQYSYVIAVKLRTGEDAPAPAFELGGVSAELHGGRVSVVGRIRNTEPLLVKGAQVLARVTPEGSDIPVLQRTIELLEMAPNSVFPLTLTDDAGGGLPAGRYTVSYYLYHGGRDWHFEETLTLAPDEAAALNEGAVNTPDAASQKVPVWMVAVFSAVGALAAGVILLWVIGALRSRRASRRS